MRPTLIFDGDCGFCSRSRDILAQLDLDDRIDIVPSRRPGVAERVGIPLDDLIGSVWFIGENGEQFSGAEAIHAALSVALRTNLPTQFYKLPGMRLALEAMYRWVAANRHKLPGGKTWCEQHPEQC